ETRLSHHDSGGPPCNCSTVGRGAPRTKSGGVINTPKTVLPSCLFFQDTWLTVPRRRAESCGFKSVSLTGAWPAFSTTTLGGECPSSAPMAIVSPSALEL